QAEDGIRDKLVTGVQTCALPIFRRDCRLICHAVGVLPARRFRREKGAGRLAIGLRRLLPVSPNGVPALAQPLFVGVAILRDDRRSEERRVGKGSKICTLGWKYVT